MKNINNCANIGSLGFFYKDLNFGFPVKTNGEYQGGYVGCIELENEKELEILIKLFECLLNGEDIENLIGVYEIKN